MPNAKTLTAETNRLKFLIYGPSGSGKTFGIRTFPKPYIFDSDGGVASLSGYDIDYDIYDDTNESQPDAWRSVLKQTRRFIKECPYETIVYDSITTLSELLMAETQRVNGTIGTPPNIREWGIVIDNMNSFLKSLKNIDANIVVIGHDQIKQDETTSEILITPLVPGKNLPSRLPIYFDEVYHTQVELSKESGAVYKIQTHASKRIQSKTTLKNLEYFEEYDYQKLIEKNNSSPKKATTQSSTPANTGKKR